MELLRKLMLSLICKEVSKMKKNYEKPYMLIMEIDLTDVIAASGDAFDGPGIEFWNNGDETDPTLWY